MWNETGTFRPEFSWKIRNGPRFKMRWKLFRFVSFFELVWNVSAIPSETERNWQPCSRQTTSNTIKMMIKWVLQVKYIIIIIISISDRRTLYPSCKKSLKIRNQYRYHLSCRNLQYGGHLMLRQGDCVRINNPNLIAWKTKKTREFFFKIRLILKITTYKIPNLS
jgi:hypothetical protein